MIEQQSCHTTALGYLGNQCPMIVAGTTDVAAPHCVKDHFVFRRSARDQLFGLSILNACHTLDRDGRYLDSIWQFHLTCAGFAVPAKVGYRGIKVPPSRLRWKRSQWRLRITEMKRRLCKLGMLDFFLLDYRLIRKCTMY